MPEVKVIIHLWQLCCQIESWELRIRTASRSGMSIKNRYWNRINWIIENKLIKSAFVCTLHRIYFSATKYRMICQILIAIFRCSDIKTMQGCLPSRYCSDANAGGGTLFCAHSLCQRRFKKNNSNFLQSVNQAQYLAFFLWQLCIEKRIDDILHFVGIETALLTNG